tara:strand:- start:2066 stop:3115 length:1050 start_codon:yes stop_codon:yes gene_type:complete
MTIYIIDLEPVESRYTAQWKKFIPQELQRLTNDKVVTISGGDVPQTTTPGAFLNFAGTNVYKSQQSIDVAKLFADNKVKAGDHFVYTDAWNPSIIQLQYMRQLLQVDCKIHALWHAGSYDPQDFLGRLIPDKKWSYSFETALFHAIDHNYFATDFHIEMFTKNLYLRNDPGKIVRTGWPMGYMDSLLSNYKGMKKKDMIVFPHRLAPEKQLDIFEDLSHHLPQYEWIVCQNRQLTKNEYYNILGESKIVFSANLQETLGISCYEGALVDSIPMVPDRLSYSEMYMEEFKYPSNWTIDYNAYTEHKQKIIDKITYFIDNHTKLVPHVHQQAKELQKKFFTASNLYATINA